MRARVPTPLAARGGWAVLLTRWKLRVHIIRDIKDWLVNYAEHHRAGLRVGTAITEGTTNFLVNRRMNKSQQMRWSPRGADLPLQVRRAIYNGIFGSND
jgi:hypothetical protein